MRIVSEIPHSHFKITIFSWNSKYIVKIELANFEQLFKIKEEDVTGPDDIRKMLDDEFLDAALQRFIDMRSSFTKAFQKINPL